MLSEPLDWTGTGQLGTVHTRREPDQLPNWTGGWFCPELACLVVLIRTNPQ